MKLYTGDLSPYSAKVRMQIYAKGIADIAFERPPGFLQGEFSKTSPLGRIPALDIDGDVMPESEVIAEYLEECYPLPSLLGSTPRRRAQVRTVARIADIYLMNNIFMALPQVRRTSRVEAIRDLFVAQVTRGINALEHYLGDGRYAVGDSLTLADCSLVPALFLCERVVPTLDVDNPIPNRTRTAAYWQRIQQDPHAARVLAEMTHGLAERRAGRG
jgi:glutathione S-transferase